MNFDTCKVIVWGYKNAYHTHTHIHEGFLRAFQYLKRDVQWLDQADDISHIDFENTLFVTNHDCCGGSNDYWPSAKPMISTLPIRDDCFYVVHGLSATPDVREKLKGRYLGWNVYHDFSHTHWWGGGGELQSQEKRLIDGAVWLAEDTPFYPRERYMDFRWATDLLPPEIEANKPSNVFNSESKKIWWIGTVWRVNEKELSDFSDECRKNGIEFIHAGAGQKGVISIEDNIRLVRESYFAPAISGTHHLTEGYAPCRIFKNISYGQFGITNSKRVNDIFGGKLIFNPDVRRLFYDACERLASMDVKELHALMDEVAQKHTYINRISTMLEAAKRL